MSDISLSAIIKHEEEVTGNIDFHKGMRHQFGYLSYILPEAAGVRLEYNLQFGGAGYWLDCPDSQNQTNSLILA